MKSVHLGDEDQTIIDIHDILKAYYKVALKRYMDNIVIRIVERAVLGTGGQMQTFPRTWSTIFKTRNWLKLLARHLPFRAPETTRLPNMSDSRWP